MVTQKSPPFRADHVGSLLRPKRLLEGRNQFLGQQTANTNLGPHTDARLYAVENECIIEVIEMQEEVGLSAATDGEFRRRSWWLEMIMGWDGFSATRQGKSSPFMWKNDLGKQQNFSILNIPRKIEWQHSVIIKAFTFLQSKTSILPKITMPSPSVVHCFTGGDPGILAGYYNDIDEFWEDLIKAYRKEVCGLIKAGARYIQFDDVTLPFLCDGDYAPFFHSWGSTPGEILDTYAKCINKVIAGVPDDVVFTMHTCRGNREGLWAAEGGYDFVSDVLFNQINVSGYFMEYDTPRAGTFEPLRLLPAGKIVALGIVSSKVPELEGTDLLKRRIEEAAKFTPLEQLSIAPQCGFASSIKGNPLNEVEQKAKLARLVEVADLVWANN